MSLGVKQNGLEKVLSGATVEHIEHPYIEGESGPWQDYPFHLSTYNPLTEWGDHYSKVFQRDLWPLESKFDLLDACNGQVEQRHLKGAGLVEEILKEDPDIRIFYCDSRLCDDLVTRASFTVDDIKRIFTRYDVSTVFVDRFIGRNRCVVGSRKIFSPTDPSCIQSYDLWYDLPCRIYGDAHEYDWHFILFTVYVHYDVVNQKTMLFYIHRLGSEHPSFQERSSRLVKNRIKAALEYTYKNPTYLECINGSPFALQLPTMTCAVTFWTETLHKERLNMWQKEDEGKENIAGIDISYLYNVLRYVHSYLMNMKSIQEAVQLVKAEHEWYADNIGYPQGYTRVSPAYTTVNDSLTAQLYQIQTCLNWADEVIKRTQALINLYFNRMSEIDSRATANIARETRKDAIAMRTIAFVTMFFLPGTFISAFFSMSFFQGGGPLRMKDLWLYFASAVVMTAVILGAWYYWHRRKQIKKGIKRSANTREKVV